VEKAADIILGNQPLKPEKTDFVLSETKSHPRLLQT